MALTRGFIQNAVTTPLDARLMDMAQIAGNADGSPRVGVLGGDGRAIVTALATMNVAIAAADFVTSKGTADGVAIFTNDGTVNLAITAAPASNSRIDVVWVKHNDNTTGDATSTPVFGVTAGTAAASPTKPAIPTGALELATLRVYAGTTAANGGSNTLTNTYQMTASRGGTVPFRTLADLLAWTNPQRGQVAYNIATGDAWRWNGTAWKMLAVGLNLISSGSFTGVSNVDMGGIFQSVYGAVTIEIDLDVIAPKTVVYGRLRNAGAVESGSAYFYQLLFGAGDTANAVGIRSANRWQLTTISGDQAKLRIEVSNADVARRTVALFESLSWDTAVGPDMHRTEGAAAHGVDSGYDGFRLTTDGAQKMTGRYRVYGHYAG